MDCCCKPSIILIHLQNFSGLQSLNLEQHFIDFLSIISLGYNLIIRGTCVNLESKREAGSSTSAFFFFWCPSKTPRLKCCINQDHHSGFLRSLHFWISGKWPSWLSAPSCLWKLQTSNSLYSAFPFKIKSSYVFLISSNWYLEWLEGWNYMVLCKAITIEPNRYQLDAQSTVAVINISGMPWFSLLFILSQDKNHVLYFVSLNHFSAHYGHS